jgi:hypothetical protein
MMPLAKLWSWTGHAFILFAIGWAVFVRGGLSDKKLPEGVAISQGYWGLAVSLIAATTMAFALGLYIRAAKRAEMRFLIPPNTNFEERDDRNLIISWGTLVVFATVVMTAIALFSVRYLDSVLHEWGKQIAVGEGFIGSRIEAYKQGCGHPPCFAVASQFEKGVEIPSGVNEYLLYVTDGVLIVLFMALVYGAVFAAVSVISYRAPRQSTLE